MTRILTEVQQTVSEQTALFYGHDYGLKNLHWAMAYVNEHKKVGGENPIQQYYDRALQYWKER